MAREQFDDSCYCYCHGTQEEHDTDCCDVCPYCSKAVRTEVYWEHVHDCEKEDHKKHPPPPPERPPLSWTVRSEKESSSKKAKVSRQDSLPKTRKNNRR